MPDAFPIVRQCTRCHWIYGWREPRCAKCRNPEFTIFDAIDWDWFRKHWPGQ